MVSQNTIQPTILPRTAVQPKLYGWREELKLAFRTPQALLSALGLEDRLSEALTGPAFPMLVPRPFANRMRRGDWDDPLLRQVLPDPDEQQPSPGFVDDPVGDKASQQVSGLLHKYHGRVLLVSTGACAVHCRYCFRQAFPYSTEQAGRDDWAGAVAYIRSRPDISEVILSGGDPLMLDTRRLHALTEQLADIPSIKRFRIHTRLPVVLPQRIDGAFLDWLAALPWSVVMVIHANHAQEFDDSVDRALNDMRTTRAHLLNQAVLLHGINDRLEDLVNLMERSLEAGVLPYYLHLLDKVSGARRFEQSAETAKMLLHGLRLRLPGYLVPRLVMEKAGEPYKLPVI